METTGQTAEAIGRMAQEWESATKATGDLIQAVKQSNDNKPKQAEEPVPTVQDYQKTIQGITNATTELQTLVTEVRDLIESEALTARIAELNASAAAVVDHSALQARGLTDHIAWRLIQLAGVIALLVLTYRFVSFRRLGKRS